ncbi:unnamed protein product [Urochloa decumbens]
MSNKIKQLIEDIHSLCPIISDLLNKNLSSTLPGSMANSLKRAAIGSTITQDKLYGRSTIFAKTMNQMISASATSHETLVSVLPIVGPGGIGKTTFAQHLYNDKRTEEHFITRVWVCVSNNFDVFKLTKEILSGIPVDKTDGSNGANQTSNFDQLQKSIAERLKNKRFLIVLDDIWQCNSTSEWETLMSPLTDAESEKGSMVLVTTRFPIVAETVRKATDQVNLQGLDPSEFWEFFKACVFGEVKQVEQVLIETARKIASRLKCSPLAAKTVGRLLKKNPSLEHWERILEREEWLNQTKGDDIMPALKISYDSLPFHLKKCFSYCALFPEDHRFKILEISNFWAAIGILDSSGLGGKIEDISSKYLDELVDNGFLTRGDGDYYVMHDLLHELAQIVSSQECHNISCSSFTADGIRPSIRHLSITVGDVCSNNFKHQMHILSRRIDIKNLRTLMIFGSYDTSIDSVLKDVFKELKGLRVLLIFMNSPESLPINFSKLIHLRYLKINSPSSNILHLPSTLYRFCQLKFLDLKDWGGSKDLPRNISRLVNLRHLHAGRELHSNVPGVGKMKHLQELKEFHVKKETVGFEMRELGNLTELGGALSICNLENVRTKEEANEAELMDKRNLHTLRLVWSRGQPSGGDDVLDCLQPHSSLRALHIVNHDGAICPRWLYSDICVKNLESLTLEGISWVILPPFGQIPCLKEVELKNIVGLRQLRLDLFGGFTDKSSLPLKRIVCRDMPELVEWVGGASSYLFSGLESIKCVNCPKLSTLSILGCSDPSTQEICTPNLRKLDIARCPMLSLPPMPHTSMLTDVNVNWELVYRKAELIIRGYEGDLAFHNLGNVEEMSIAPSITLTDLQKLNSLRRLEINGLVDASFGRLDGGVVLHSVQILKLQGFHLTSNSLSNVFECFPALLDLYISPLEWDHEEVVLQLPSSSSMQKLAFFGCNNLILPVEDGGVLWNLTSLQSLSIQGCGRFLSLWSVGEATQVINPFPASLRELCISNEPNIEAMGLLSNLRSLTHLKLSKCGYLTMDGFNPLITFNLKSLVLVKSGLYKSPSGSIAADLFGEMTRKNAIMPARSFQLQHLEVDRISAPLVSPICSHFSTTLQKLTFSADPYAVSFTEEQDQVIQHFTSLQQLEFFGCLSLQFIPEGLHRLSSLKKLVINGCPKIISLPKEGLPSSLKQVKLLTFISNELHEACNKLKEERPDLNIVFI